MAAEAEWERTPASERGQGAIGLAETGWVPDGLIRAGIRRLCRRRLRDIDADDAAAVAMARDVFVAAMNRAEVAPLPQRANEQHYEVPAEFFDVVLGAHRKYSCACWDETTPGLDEAEARALALSCERAGVADGMSVLDLGCGWGSLSLWIAGRHPGCRVTAVSNSAAQRRHIEALAARRGLDNLRVITADMNDFDIESRFDRIVSVEMFEHMRNYGALFERIGRWLNPGGRFFMHIFCHRDAPYAFEDNGPGDWMSRHFFSGGIMPSADLPLRFSRDLAVERQWAWDGTHYQRTADAWLARLDANREAARRLLTPVYGEAQVERWIQRWRIFFMACAELFGLDGGRQWYVSHYRFRRQADAETGG